VLGGVKLAMIAHWFVLVATLGMAMSIARRLGASPLAVAWGTALSIPVALWGWQMRAQNLACPLFVAVVGLLLLDGRGPPRRAFWTLPLLVVWANVHGSVLIGVALVGLFAATAAGPVLRRGALAAGACATVFASPYGLSLVHYYHFFLGNPDMKVVAEWRSGLALRGDAYPFLALLAISGVLVLRQRRRLTAFQVGLLLLTAVAGMQAIRNALWFSYALALVLPLAIDGTRPLRRAANRELSRLYPAVGVLALIVALAVLAGQHGGWYVKRWPAEVPARVAAAVRLDPAAGAFATERYADWLLWRRPELAGRLAYDARLELLPRRTFRQVVAFAGLVRGRWAELPDRYGVLVLDTRQNRRQWTALRREPGRRIVYQDRTVTVLGGRAGRPE
jgi:hypothetical protein